jgi:hypothetical protein
VVISNAERLDARRANRPTHAGVRMMSGEYGATDAAY